jgi:hypothetical protein
LDSPCFVTSRIEYYHVFDLVSVLAYTFKFVNFDPIAVFKIHVNSADFGLIAVVNVKHQYCRLWDHHRRQHQASTLLTLGSSSLLILIVDSI